jgi:hypothetical protein
MWANIRVSEDIEQFDGLIKRYDSKPEAFAQFFCPCWRNVNRK